ncbi:hypothetical protein HPB49_005298 [Dermacentor silvarum]|uniref:Uncharacterized protein n=1 Tax=Dermacentor silvarum TaxID=543639 RepID=A0ACB8DMU3_DERSI|nr:hypothetical protein HPB49_005298 [Dermacentor silvarum]
MVMWVKCGFNNLTGVDYVENAVILAKELAAKEAVSVLFEVGDILEQDLPCPSFSRKYDFVLDKGTYDAISLCPDNPQKKRRCYLEVVSQLLATGGHFVIVSCNWTQQELTAHFNRGKDAPPKLAEWTGTLRDAFPLRRLSAAGRSRSRLAMVMADDMNGSASLAERAALLLLLDSDSSESESSSSGTSDFSDSASDAETAAYEREFDRMFRIPAKRPEVVSFIEDVLQVAKTPTMFVRILCAHHSKQKLLHT